MRPMIVAMSMAALVMWQAPSIVAQETKSARGAVTAMAGNSITVKAGASEMKFTVDAKTTVNVEGGGTATRAAAAKGTAGPTLAELIKVGDAVEVSYHDVGGTLHAASVRKVASPGAGGGTTSDARATTKSDSSSGTVESVSGSMLTITGAGGGGATFKQSFTVDAETRVVGSGVGTAAAPKGGKIVFTDHVGKGDRVTVTYHPMGSSLHADEVRVTQKVVK